MIRERIGQAALRAYPPAVRHARGPEMLGMLADAAEPSIRSFVRESGSLVLGGLRERAAMTARVGTRRLIADSCCQAVLIWVMLWMISALNTEVFAGPSPRLRIQVVVLAEVLAAALVGYDRIAAVGGLAAMGAFGPLGLHTQLAWLATALVLTACLVVMMCAPRKRPRDRRRLLWLLPVCVLAALYPHAELRLAEVLAVVSLAGLLRLFHDPRLAIACSLVWIIGILALLPRAGQPGPAGLGSLVILAFTAAGLMLTLAAGRLWIIRHGAPT